MFLKKLIIFSNNKIIREINFKLGLNLIVDDVYHIDEKKRTGNSVGKTTFLKVIDYCLGGELKGFFETKESKINNYLKEQLINNNYLIQLEISKSWNDLENIIIKRNFVSKKQILKINDKTFDKLSDFTNELNFLFFQNKETKKPTFRELISQNIRYTDEKINNILKLNFFKRNAEYENLILFLLGFKIDLSSKKNIEKEIKEKNDFLKNVDKVKGNYEENKSKLNSLNFELQKYYEFRNKLKIDRNIELDLEKLLKTRREIEQLSFDIQLLDNKINIIENSIKNIKDKKDDTDYSYLKYLYNETNHYVKNLQKTFEDFINFNNKMIKNKIDFIGKDLPNFKKEKENKLNELFSLHKTKEMQEIRIGEKEYISSLENILDKISKIQYDKSLLESNIEFHEKIMSEINTLNGKLNEFNNIYEDDFKKKAEEKADLLSNEFGNISQILYEGERYGFTIPIREKRVGKSIFKYYDFETYNWDTSSGKKQGEVLSFDIAYILFAKKNNLPHSNFILNDKKELMHSNQILAINDFLKNQEIQLIFSILKDKIPNELLEKDNIILSLTDKDKLFKI
nr:DUF2326 domain-containing protein [Mycoplasmopsis canis]WQQ12569.1 hypothetical protein RRG48_00795 [Mycoplasmopsis canis]